MESPGPTFPIRMCDNPSWSLRATRGSVPARRSAQPKHLASKSFGTQAWQSLPYEIASVISLPRNDITTQLLKESERD
jgi:hypothetical protein